MADQAQLIRQLRTTLRLTQTEEQTARTRELQARSENVRKELRQNADDARRRTRAIARELRAVGGVPDVVSPLAGRAVALVKSTMAQAMPFEEALLQDLALEQQLRSRARHLGDLAEAANRGSTRALAERLEKAHGETVEWIESVLADEARGGPTKLRATPLQRVVGGVTLAVNVPVRVARHQLDRAADRVSRVADRARGTAEDVYEKARATAEDAYDDVRTAGRDAADVVATGADAAAERAEQVARRDGAGRTAEAAGEARRTTARAKAETAGRN